MIYVEFYFANKKESKACCRFCEIFSWQIFQIGDIFRIALEARIIIRFCSLRSVFFKNFQNFSIFITSEVDKFSLCVSHGHTQNGKNGFYRCPWETNKLKLSTSEVMKVEKFRQFLKKYRPQGEKSDNYS